MKSEIKKQRLQIGGMTCISCQNRIERALGATAGVQAVKVDYRTGTGDVAYDSSVLSLKEITSAVEALGYHVLPEGGQTSVDTGRVFGFLAVIAALYLFLQRFGILNFLAPGKLADTGMGYGMLFVIGLLTSVHCIAMCGGINLSQCLPRGGVSEGSQSRFSALRPALLYNLGRVISYTAAGFVLGLVGFLFGGGADAGLPVLLQGILKLIAGGLMVVIGVNMLGIFPFLRKFQPGIPHIFAGNTRGAKNESASPLTVGLLNGLMPCGPLQSMQIVSLVSGNPFSGALSMFLFSLGTVPLMLGLGSIVSALGKKFAAKVMSAGAVLVVVLGLAMISQGVNLSGFLPAAPWQGAGEKTGGNGASAGVEVQLVDGAQVVRSTLTSRTYPDITVQEGIPVKWIIDAPEGSVNGCNDVMIINDYGIEYGFETGENVIEFTPDQAGIVRYSCWMGMIQATITVTEAEAHQADGASD